MWTTLAGKRGEERKKKWRAATKCREAKGEKRREGGSAVARLARGARLSGGAAPR